MRLPAVFNRIISQKRKAEILYAVKIEEDCVKTASWRKVDVKVEIIKTAQAHYRGGWTEGKETAKRVLKETKANGDKLTRVVFGLPASWIEEDRITESHLGDLKAFCREENLKPAGFVTIEEAIIHRLRTDEGTPLNAILVKIGLNNLSVSLIRASKVIFRRSLITTDEDKRETSEHVAVLLADFPERDNLPSRFILYDHDDDLETEKQDLISYPWMQRFSFLHFPNVEILEENFDINALIFTTVQELNGKTKNIQTEGLGENEEVAKEPKHPLATPEELGFIKEKDINKEDPEVLRQKEDSGEEPSLTGESKQLIGQKTGHLKIGLSFPKLKFPDVRFVHSPLALKPKLRLIPLAVLALVTATSIAAYWYIPKAEIRFYLDPKIAEKETKTTVSLKSEAVDLEKGIILGTMVENSEVGSKKGVTTGKKTVGEKAQGEIIVYNKTPNGKTLPAQTVIVSTSNIFFTLDQDVVISSATAGVESTTYGKAKAKVTAKEIGSQANLPTSSEFSFKDYPTTSYSARNENPLTGGTSREVFVVAKEDIERLLATLSGELRTKGEENLIKKISGSQKIVTQTITSTVISKKYDKEIGDEAREITLELKTNLKTLTFDQNDFKKVIEKQVASSTSDNYEADERTLEEKIVAVEGLKNGDTLMTVIFKISLLPKINIDEIKKNLVGRSIKDGDKYLKAGTFTKKYDLKMKPELPFLKIFPHVQQNIKIDTQVSK